MKNIFTLVLVLFGLVPAFAQDDLSALLDSIDKASETNEPVKATFKNGHLINQHTIETPGPRSLDFRISHRFGDLKGGAYTAFGVDGPATMRLGLDYSYDGRLVFGIGRTSYEKAADASVKYKLLQQKSKGMPITLTLISTAFYTFEKLPAQNGFDKYQYEVNRLSYSHEMIIGRKFSGRFSAQLAPAMVHYNIVDHVDDRNDVFAILGGMRFKLTTRIAIIAEASYCLNDYSPSQIYYNSAGIGLDIETGGHVFQVFLTNAAGINENQFIPHAHSAWRDGGIKLGFNISRAFHI